MILLDQNSKAMLDFLTFCVHFKMHYNFLQFQVLPGAMVVCVRARVCARARCDSEPTLRFGEYSKQSEKTVWRKLFTPSTSKQWDENQFRLQNRGEFAISLLIKWSALVAVCHCGWCVSVLPFQLQLRLPGLVSLGKKRSSFDIWLTKDSHDTFYSWLFKFLLTEATDPISTRLCRLV